jgi:hypothetical protein
MFHHSKTHLHSGALSPTINVVCRLQANHHLVPNTDYGVVQYTSLMSRSYVTDACIAGRPVRFGLLSRGIAIARDMFTISRE